MALVSKPLMQQRTIRRIWKTPGSQLNWLFLVLALIILGSVYLIYRSAVATQPYPGPINDPFREFGIVSFGLVLVVTAYTLRRRFVRRLPGKVQDWLWLHIWFGIISVLIACMHDNLQNITHDFSFASDRFTEGFYGTTALYALLLLVITGVIGRLLDVGQARVITTEANTNGVGIIRSVEERLFDLKQSGHQFSLTFAKNSLEQSKVNIDQLYGAFADLAVVVNAGRNDNEIEQALGIVITKTNDSRTVVANVPAGPEHKQVQRDLDHALSDEKRILSQLLTHVGWSVQLAFTQQLGKLGDAVPMITNVVISRQSDGTALITLSGTSFAQQTRLIINGQVKGTVITASSKQLIAVINQSDWPQGVYAVGVLGSDGMATQVMTNASNNNNNRQGGDDHYGGNKKPAPVGIPKTDDGSHYATPISTRTSDDHHSGSGGSDN